MDADAAAATAALAALAAQLWMRKLDNDCSAAFLNKEKETQY